MTSKARNLANLLADGSIGAAEIANGSILTAKLGDGAVTAAKLGDNGSWAPGLAVIRATMFRDATRRSMPTQGSYVETNLGGTFTKVRSDTVIIATSTVFGAGFSAGNCGVGLRMNASSWDHGMAYQYDGQWSTTQQTTPIIGTHRWTGLAAGNHTVYWGWNVVGGGANKPFNFLNPDNNDDVRNYQMISSIIVYEVAP